MSSTAHRVFNEGILVIFALLMVYMLFEAFKHKHHLKFGHEASLVSLVGLIISCIYMSSGTDEFGDIMAFNDDLFFYFVLPPIVFASGFNMYRKKFFANIANITLFGVISTFICFSIFSGLTILVLTNLDLKQWTYDPVTQTWSESAVEISNMEVLLMCSLLCSSDVIAAVSLLSPKDQPKLFSLVFGEGIVNDAVSIILFNTVNDIATAAKTDGHSDFNAKDAGLIALQFVLLGLVSILIGLIFGLTLSYILKKMKSLTKNPVVESAMIFSFAYISYVTAELSHQSGIITLLTCGITIAHYGWYNLSPQGQTTSTIVFQFLGFLAEGFVFSYLGLTFFSYRTMPFSFSLIGIELAIVICGRAVGTMGLISLLKCVCKYERNHPAPLTIRELVFIWYAGLIRGAIAFGLVLRISPDFPARNLIVTTSLTLVLFTTIFFGSTVGLLGSCLFPKEVVLEQKLNEGEQDEEPTPGDLYEQSDSGDDSSDRSEMLHPNLLATSEHKGGAPSSNDDFQRANSLSKRQRRKQQRSCFSYLQRFDEFCMKPIFIRRYTPLKEYQADQLFNTQMEDANTIEKMYVAGSSEAGTKRLKTHIIKGKSYDAPSGPEEVTPRE